MAKRYDNVRITNAVDGSVIEGHDAVEAHFERERKLAEEHGSTLTFQLYRANLAGTTRADVQGPRLAELRIAGGEVSGTDTVAGVKQRILPTLLGEHAGATHITFVFGGRVMRDEALFYADHFMLLPCWVQVLLSEVPFVDFIAAIQRLPK
ncbi:MAG: hypothetical protein ABJE66_28940 [Deltaproteobacteria bacterium]